MIIMRNKEISFLVEYLTKSVEEEEESIEKLFHFNLYFSYLFEYINISTKRHRKYICAIQVT